MDDSKERRRPLTLTEEELERLMEQAAEKAIKKLTSGIYQEVGKGVISKLIYVLGALAVALWMYINSGLPKP